MEQNVIEFNDVISLLKEGKKLNLDETKPIVLILNSDEFLDTILGIKNHLRDVERVGINKTLYRRYVENM
jgi:hypothetical protein